MSGPTPERIDQFRIVREIGHGGMGVIYEAVEEPVGRHVALKVLPASAAASQPEFRERFLREIRTTANLAHPNIIQVHHIGEFDGRPYYTMEYVAGVSLEDLKRRPWMATEFRAPPTRMDAGAGTAPLERTVVLPATEPTPTVVSPAEPDADRAGGETHEAPAGRSRFRPGKEYYLALARFIRDAARGLAFAHRHGIIHRDVKPSNILISGDGQVRVTDFGIAFEWGGKELTRAGAILGTPRYMSPEQLLRRDITVDCRTDVYSLGVTMYELLTLSPAFEANSDHQLLLQIVVQDPRKPRTLNPTVPRDLETVVLKAMEKDPDRRYQTAEAFADDLNRFLHDEPILAIPPTFPTRCVRTIRRHKILSTAMAAAAAFTLVGAGIAWQVQRLRRQAEVRELGSLARSAMQEGDCRRAVRLLEAAHRLNKGDTLVAAELVRARERVRKWERDKDLQQKMATAREMIADAKDYVEAFTKAGRHRRELRQKIQQAFRDLNGVRPCNEKADKARLQKDLARMQRELRKAEAEAPNAFAAAGALLFKALSLVPAADVPRRELADFYFAAMCEAERNGDTTEAASLRKLAALFDDGRLQSELSGAITVGIETTPAGANLALLRYVESGHRLIARPERELGSTPVDSITLPAGDYLLRIEKPGFRSVRYPFFARRGDRLSIRVPLYTDAQIGSDMIYVPPGRFIQGADPQAEWPLPSEQPSLPGFFIGRTEVTFKQYVDFVNDVCREDYERAKRLLPRMTPTGKKLYWDRNARGEYEVPFTLDGKLPVSGITVESIEAYCAWRSKREGRRVRLPTAAEWEKAARGADGRFFVWGNRANPGSCNMRYWANTLTAGKMGPKPAGSFPDDCSPYGVLDMNGNVCEVCGDDFDTAGDRNVRGGAWYLDYLTGRLASRKRKHPSTAHRAMGFRVATDSLLPQ
ncbi:MAG: SUMF1/EgtB/PvdO family nonheme iron enzyme [Kiritimatiellaeota bacterium]|nr:SUMF1/EgtB/PvdO family nonheme iron enzyme [Kiritimatiellota bacterium]